MRLLSINMNDFGGSQEHLMEHKKYNAWLDRECIDWKYWSSIDKSCYFDMFIQYINEKNPDILIINEMIVSPIEEIDFISKIKEQGFLCFDENIPNGKFSFTMMFYRNVECALLPSPNVRYRENRSILYSTNGIYINGTHFPQESDEKFLRDVEKYSHDHKDKKLIIMGDLNANDSTRGNKQLVENLISDGYKDVWVQMGNPSDTPTELKYKGRLDYVIASKNVYDLISNMEIDSYTMNSGMTDHAALIVDLNI